MGFGDDMKIFVIGGSLGKLTLSTVEVYSPKSNTWAPGASMRTMRANFAAASFGMSIVAVGGQGNQARMSGEALRFWHECDPSASGGCTTCAACCNAKAFPDGGACEACYLEKCVHFE